MPEAGLEQAQYHYRWILNPLRLPFRHSGTERVFNACFSERLEGKVHLTNKVLHVFSNPNKIGKI